MTQELDPVFALSPTIRYVSVLKNGSLTSRQRPGVEGASEAESDRYEELLVNPTLLKLASQRGEFDCGGLTHIVVGYGHFHQLVLPIDDGHVSVCFELGSEPQSYVKAIAALFTGKSHSA